MKVSALIDQWEKSGAPRLSRVASDLVITEYDRARVRALVDMYPGKSEADILSELVAAALDEIEAALPYRPGSRIIREDELGDPVYEDAGPTPRFARLVKEHLARLRQDSNA